MQFLEIKNQLIEAKREYYSYSHCLHLRDLFKKELAVASDKDIRFILIFYYAALIFRCDSGFSTLLERDLDSKSEFKFIRSGITDLYKEHNSNPEVNFLSVTTISYKDVSFQVFYTLFTNTLYVLYDQNLFKFDLAHYGLDECYFNRFVCWYLDRKGNEITNDEGVIDI
jgi:hypothetical protein